MATTTNMQTSSPKKLLCLDGGGVKGISSLMILQAIMKEVQRIEDSSSATTDQTKAGTRISSHPVTSLERKPSHYFDLTGGTSTGGIIAVMIGRLDMNCTEAIKVYKELSSEIFAVRVFGMNIGNMPILNNLGSLVLTAKTLLGTQFSDTYINQGIDKILNDRGIDLNDRSLVKPEFKAPDAQGKMLLCATMADRGKAILFRNYTPPSDAIPETGSHRNEENAPSASPQDVKTESTPGSISEKNKLLLKSFDYNKVSIKEAVRATSAAPTYLPPEIIQDIQFWDGGCLNNNPVDQAWAARYDLAPDQKTEPYVSTVVSIGTTYCDATAEKQSPGMIRRLFGILNTSLGFMTNTEAKHMDFKRNIYRRNLRQPNNQTFYCRFNAPVSDPNVDMADYKKIPFLEAETKKYLELKETKDKILACAESLLRKK